MSLVNFLDLSEKLVTRNTCDLDGFIHHRAKRVDHTSTQSKRVLSKSVTRTLISTIAGLSPASSGDPSWLFVLQPYGM